MRKQGQIYTVAALAVICAAPLVAGGEDAKANGVLAAARKALGGERRLASLKGLSIRTDFRREASTPFSGGGGGTFVVMGGGGRMDAGGQITGSIEIDLLLPDRFYRSESGSGGFSLTRIDGFEGDRPFMDLIADSPGTRVAIDRPADDPARAKALLRRTNTDLARLLLGMIAGTQPGLAATYTYVGQAESPDGTAHVIDVTGAHDFKARLFIDTVTNLPLMLTYTEAEVRPIRMTMTHGAAPPTRADGAGASGSTARRDGSTSRVAGVPNLTPEQQAELDKQIAAAEAEPPKLVEYRMFFADYREVSGISLPHRISRGTAEKTVEEWDVKDYKVNPNISLDRFKVGS